MSCFRHTLFIAILAIVGMTFSESSSAQAISEMRDWTNQDGKKIQAELLTFGDESNDGLVRLRLKTGSVFKVNPETLTRADQALILKARFENRFRSKFSERMNAHFFYSKKVPADEQRKKTVAYIGNDFEGAWLRIKAFVNSDVAVRGIAFLAVGQGTEPIRIEYDEDSIEFDRGSATLDLSLTKHADAFATLLENPEKMKLVIENETGIYSEIKLSDSEIEALGEVIRAYGDLKSLTTDHIWWTTFQGIDPVEFTELLRAKENPPEPETAGMANKQEGPVLPAQ
ncbi:MAG: hypothetical protein HKN23_06730, partial [Verrucomicrobiales bacterium]|nr:hypothetical protein [Verrucomicrobiales bacterium]